MKVLRNWKKSLLHVWTIVMIFMISTVPVLATDPNKDDVVTVYQNNWFVINVITAILVVVALVATAFEFLIHRKNIEEREKTMGGIPFIIAAIVILAVTLQIVTRMQF